MSGEKKSRLRRILIRIAAAVIILLVVAILLLFEWSPAAHVFYRTIGAITGKAMPGLSVTMARAGLLGQANGFSVTDLDCKAGDFAEIRLDKFTIRYRLAPLLVGKGSVREITISNLVVRLDSTKPLPASFKSKPPAKKKETGPKGPLPFDTVRLPYVGMNDAIITMTFAATTSAPPTTVVLTNMTLGMGPGRAPAGKLPYPFELRGALRVDGGTPAPIICNGSACPGKLEPDNADFDIAFSLKKLNLGDFNSALSAASPFMITSGELNVDFSAHCREGQLAGLATVTTSNLVIRPNEKGASTFLRLSLDSWLFLVSNRKGMIRIDCPISGTLRQPVVPIGAILAQQAGAIGRRITGGVLGTVSGGLLDGVGDSLDADAEDRSRYDDILKVERADASVQHFEKARHYEIIVKDYATALKEYAAQVSTYPADTNRAVRSLQAVAEIKNVRLSDPRGSVAALRVLIDSYTSHPDADDAMLKMIDTHIDHKQYPEANDLCSEFGRKFPHSGLSAQVEERQKKIAKYVW